MTENANPTSQAPTLTPSDTATSASSGFTQRHFRDALGQFATGVTVVTARLPDGQPVGLTVSSFNSVSLAPPLVLWSLARSASTLEALLHSPHYAINVLSAGQEPLALQFAAKAADRFDGVAHVPGPQGSPMLQGAAVTLECRNRSRHEEGDHIIFVGEVLSLHPHPTPVDPLIYHGGRFYAGVSQFLGLDPQA